jgi:tRNA dimethylallyltransferase
MLELGLIGEVRWLRRHYALDLSMPSMRCVGYRQVWKYLEGEYTLEVMRERAVAATRQLAKRQLTWLRAMKDVTEFDCFAECVVEEVLAYLEAVIDAPGEQGHR